MHSEVWRLGGGQRLTSAAGKNRVSFSRQIKAVMPSDADPSVSFPRTVPMYSHEKPDDLPVTLGMAQESGSTLRGCPLNVPHGKESRWPQDLTKHTRLMK